jgi:hypothetical protein
MGEAAGKAGSGGVSPYPELRPTSAGASRVYLAASRASAE